MKTQTESIVLNRFQICRYFSRSWSINTRVRSCPYGSKSLWSGFVLAIISQYYYQWCHAILWNGMVKRTICGLCASPNNWNVKPIAWMKMICICVHSTMLIRRLTLVLKQQPPPLCRIILLYCCESMYTVCTIRWDTYYSPSADCNYLVLDILRMIMIHIHRVCRCIWSCKYFFYVFDF